MIERDREYLKLRIKKYNINNGHKGWVFIGITANNSFAPGQYPGHDPTSYGWAGCPNSSSQGQVFVAGQQQVRLGGWSNFVEGDVIILEYQPNTLTMVIERGEGITNRNSSSSSSNSRTTTTTYQLGITTRSQNYFFHFNFYWQNEEIEILDMTIQDRQKFN